MEVETGTSFFSHASGEPASEPNLFFDPEFDSCLKILQKPYSCRSEDDNAFIVKKTISLDVFKKSVLDNLNAKTVLTKLTPHMYFEYFPANSVLSEYDSPSEKFSILLQGRAKEFIPKTLQEMEKEADNCSKELKSKKNCGTIQSITELCVPASLTSLGRDDDCNSQIPTMNTLADREYANSATENSKEKFVKINTVLPSLRRLASPKFKNENLDDGQCKKVLRRMKGTIDVLNLEGILDADFAEKQIDEQAVAEFKKHENYYLGGILKLKFSRFLCIGDHYGLNLLRGDSVANRTIIATEDCYCLTIPKEDYIRVLENEKELNKDKIEFFQKLFADKFHSRSLAEFALLWDNQIYQMNQTIFHQDDAADTLHVLVSGEVVISKTLDVSVKKVQTSDDLPLKIKKRHDSNEQLLKLVTICAGNFFGEEDFFNGHQRKITATVSSTRAKVFKLSMQNYGTAHKEYRDIVHEIEGLVRAKKTWEKQRLEYLSQQCEPKQQTPEQFYKKKHQVIQFDHNTSKYNNPDVHPKKLIVFKKEKPVNIRFQYDKFFVPKPEKGYPGYYDVVAEDKAKSLTPHHKMVPPTKGLNFLNLRSEDHENSVEDQKSEFLPSVSQVDMKRSSSEFNRKNNDKNQQQTMRKILDSHLTGARKQMKKQHSDNNFHAFTENSLKISTRYLNPEEEYTLRVSNITKNSHDGLRLDSDPSLKPFCSNSAQTPVRPLSRAGACPPKNLMSELMHLLPLSVRTSVQPCTNLHSSVFHDPLRIVSLNGSTKTRASARRKYPEAAALLAEKVAKGGVRIVKADIVNDQIMKSEATQNNKENGMEGEKIGTSLGMKCPTKVTLLTRSKSSFIKKI